MMFLNILSLNWDLGALLEQLNMKLNIFSLLILIFSPLALSQMDTCASAANCGECTSIPNCVWCRQPVNFSKQVRSIKFDYFCVPLGFHWRSMHVEKSSQRKMRSTIRGRFGSVNKVPEKRSLDSRKFFG